MSAAEIYTGGQAPADAAKNTEFHQKMVDFLIAGAREFGWSGAEFCDYDRVGAGVSIGIKPGDAWPGLDALRTFREQHRNDPPRRLPEPAGEDGQGALAL
jgi:hypothetical protein